MKTLLLCLALLAPWPAASNRPAPVPAPVPAAVVALSPADVESRAAKMFHTWEVSRGGPGDWGSLTNYPLAEAWRTVAQADLNAE